MSTPQQFPVSTTAFSIWNIHIQFSNQSLLYLRDPIPFLMLCYTPYVIKVEPIFSSLSLSLSLSISISSYTIGFLTSWKGFLFLGFESFMFESL
ncbi:hypothetical protein ACS0TY_000893 [Phlomoides rotata]